MNMLLENPIPIYAVGAVLVTLCGLVFVARRNAPTLFILGMVVLLTLLLIVTEKLVVTPGEEIESVVARLFQAIEANDLQGVLAEIDPAAAEIRTDVETLMPRVRIEDAGATSLLVEVDLSTDPPTATGEFRGRLNGVHSTSGGRVFYFDRVLVDWTKKNGRWLLTGYTPTLRGKPINAVNSLRSNRPAR